MKTRLAVLGFLTFATINIRAEIISVGVKGGVPLTDAFEAAQGNSSAYVTNTRRYTVGPTIELHLPARFSLEVDGLYTHTGFDETILDPNGAFISTRANTWTFPMLVKFEILPGPIRPFVDMGASVRHITGIRQLRSAVSASTFGTVEIHNPAEFNKRNDVGLTFGGGVAFKAGPLRISPEFRYVRWGGENFRDPLNALLRTSRNDGVFLVGFTF